MAAPIVAERNDSPEGINVYAKSKAHELSEQDPNFSYQYVSLREDHPQFVERYLKPREIGNPVAGFITLDPWEIVRKGEVVQGQKRQDDTKGIDTKVTHGSLTLIRTPKANANRARLMDERMTEMTSKALSTNERGIAPGNIRYGVQVYHGNGESGAGDATINSANLTGGK